MQSHYRGTYAGGFLGLLSKSGPGPTSFPPSANAGLGRYVFSHDWQLQWIIKHGKKLRKLYLYDCPIVTRPCTLDDFDKDGYPLSEGNPWVNDLERIKMNYATWSEYLDEMARALPELQVFKMFHETDTQRKKRKSNHFRSYPEIHEDMEVGIRTSRYVERNTARCDPWVTWLGHDRDRKRILDQYRRDLAALKPLLRTVAALRRSEDIY